MSQVVHASSPEQAQSVAEFFRSVWRDGDEVVPQDLILAATHVGGYCAYISNENGLLAASFGLLGHFAEKSVLHSHVTASVVPGLGFALKQHQRAWAVERNIDGITWTFDPLIRRNAVFNFEKLGATAIEYLPNFYGSMTDSINLGDESDRLFTYWPARESSVPAFEIDAISALVNESEKPVILQANPASAFWVELPADIESMRQSDLASVKLWRSSVRELIKPKLDAGWTISSVNGNRTAILVALK